MTYEERVRLEAEQSAARLVSRPPVPPLMAAGFVGALTVIVMQFLLGYSQNASIIIALCLAWAVGLIVAAWEFRFQRVVGSEWLRIDRRHGQPERRNPE